MTDDPRIPGELDEVLDEELSALVDGELAPERAAELTARAEHEPRLRERIAAFERVDAALRAIPEPALSPRLEAGLRDRIARAEREPEAGRAAPRRPGRLRRLAVGTGLAAAAALALAVLLELHPPVVPEPSEPLVATLEAASEEELAVALAAEDALGGPRADEIESPQDLAIIEELDFVERLEAHVGSGRG